VWQSPDPIIGQYMSGQTNGGVFNPRNLSLFTYTANNPVNLVDSDGESFFKAASLSAKVAYKAYKVKGKLTSKKFKKIIKDEGMDIIDDIDTFFDGNVDLNDLGALIDLVVGTNLNNKATKAAKRTHGNKLDDKSAEGYTLRDLETGEVKKFGETTRGENKFGSGKQKRYSKKYLKKHNVEYKKEVSGTKKDMHKWQHEKILDHKAQNGGERPKMNKSDY